MKTLHQDASILFATAIQWSIWSRKQGAIPGPLLIVI